MSKLFHKKTIAARMALTATVCVAVSSQALVIDDFSTGNFTMDYAPNREVTELSQTNLPPAAVIGGSRDISAWSFDTPGPNPPVLEVAEGSLWIRTGAENWAYPTIVYGDAESPLNADFTSAGDALVISVVSAQTTASVPAGPLFLYGGNTQEDGSLSRDRLSTLGPYPFVVSDTPYDVVLPFSGLGDLDLSLMDQFEFSMFRVPDNARHEIAAIQVLPAQGLMGDMDRSGQTDLADVAAFVAAMENPQQYTRDHDLSPIYHGDLNDDGVFDLADI